MAAKQQNIFSKKIGIKKMPVRDLSPHVPQRVEEPEEYINEYGTIEEAPRPGAKDRKWWPEKDTREKDN